MFSPSIRSTFPHWITNRRFQGYNKWLMVEKLSSTALMEVLARISAIRDRRRAEFSGQNVVPQIFSERCKLLEGSSHPEFHKELPLPRACLRARLLIAHSRHLVLRCYTDCVHKPSGCMQTSNSWILLFVTPFFPLASQCQGWRKNAKKNKKLTSNDKGKL